MKLEEMLTESATVQDCYVVYVGDNESAYDAVSAVFKLFGYSDHAVLSDFDFTTDELNDIMYDAVNLADDIGVWSKRKVTKAQVLKSVELVGALHLR